MHTARSVCIGAHNVYDRDSTAWLNREGNECGPMKNRIDAAGADFSRVFLPGGHRLKTRATERCRITSPGQILILSSAVHRDSHKYHIRGNAREWLEDHTRRLRIADAYVARLSGLNAANSSARPKPAAESRATERPSRCSVSALASPLGPEGSSRVDRRTSQRKNATIKIIGEMDTPLRGRSSAE